MSDRGSLIAVIRALLAVSGAVSAMRVGLAHVWLPADDDQKRTFEQINERLDDCSKLIERAVDELANQK